VDVARLQQRLLDEGCERAGAIEGYARAMPSSICIQPRPNERVGKFKFFRREKRATDARLDVIRRR